jgi:hypothetical protein
MPQSPTKARTLDTSQLKMLSRSYSKAFAEQHLRELAEAFRQDPSLENLNLVERQALRMIFNDPDHSEDVMPLLKEVLPLEPEPPDSPTKN